MKAWKVILAVAVIFAAGVVTGGLTSNARFEPPPSPRGPNAPAGARQRGAFADRLQRELNLTTAQRARIEEILKESQDKTKQLWDSIAPQADAEHRRVRERIREQLTPEQLGRYEKVFRSRGYRKPGDSRPNKDELRRSEDPRSLKRPC